MKQKIYRDPVFGKKINRQKAQVFIKYKGYGYFFCCPLCQKEFEQHPDEYSKLLQKWAIFLLRSDVYFYVG